MPETQQFVEVRQSVRRLISSVVRLLQQPGKCRFTAQQGFLWPSAHPHDQVVPSVLLLPTRNRRNKSRQAWTISSTAATPLWMMACSVFDVIMPAIRRPSPPFSWDGLVRSSVLARYCSMASNHSGLQGNTPDRHRQKRTIG